MTESTASVMSLARWLVAKRLREDPLQTIEHAVDVLPHGRDVAADGAEVIGTGLGAPRSRDLLLELDHADVSLALVVRKGERCISAKA
jgi:hypothetical protein